MQVDLIIYCAFPLQLDSLQNRLLAANMEKDKAVNARNDLERDYHMEKQAHLRFVERKEDEVNMLKDNNQVREESMLQWFWLIGWLDLLSAKISPEAGTRIPEIILVMTVLIKKNLFFLLTLSSPKLLLHQDVQWWAILCFTHIQTHT